MADDKIVEMKRGAVGMLSLEGVKLRIGDAFILNGISFSVAAGETVGIIGPNGSGKTTLFNTISGFLFPTSGSIAFKGTPVTRLGSFDRARMGMGRVFQNFGIFKEMTVLENVVTALECHEPMLSTVLPWGRTHRRLREEARAFLHEVGLEGKATAKAGSLSGGQMRLLEIIRTVAFRADLCLLDEPTAGVSPKMKDSVADLIIKLQKLGKTVLIIEHDINFIQRFCDRILVLDGGRVVLDGTPEEVRQDARLQEIYFGAADAESPQARSGAH